MNTITLQAKAQEEEASRQRRGQEKLQKLHVERGKRDKPKRQKQLLWRATNEKEVTQGRREIWVLPGMEEKQKVCGEKRATSTVMDSGLDNACTAQLSNDDLDDIEVQYMYTILCLFMYSYSTCTCTACTSTCTCMYMYI